jgi:Tol biopolymer transport system component
MRATIVLALSVALAVLAVACNGGGEALRTATPEASPSATATPAATATPQATAIASPVPTQTPVEGVQPVLLEEGAHITEAGTYLAEVATGRIWWLGDRGGVWSPDGKTLASWGCCIGQGELEVIDVPAGTAVHLVDGDMADAAWSADGSQIYFSPAEGSLPAGLYAINRDGSGLKRLWDRRSGGIERSPSGDRIAFESGGQVYLLELPSGEIAEVAADAARFVTWSPDGRWLAFNNDSGLYLYEPATGERQQLDEVSGAEQGGRRFAAWSPDGRQLAFVSDDGLYLNVPDTGERRQLVAGQASGPILWSPDSSRIAFRFGPRVAMTYGAYAHDPQVGQQLVHVVEVDGSTEPKPLPPARSPSWCPDGTSIAYLSEGCITGEWNVYTVRPDGSSAKRLSDTPDSAKEGPAWSPTGSSIAYSTLDKLMLVDADSGEARTLAVSDALATIGAPLHLHGSPWSSDGQYIAFGIGGAHGICD